MRLLPLCSSLWAPGAAAVSTPRDGENHPPPLDGTALGGSPSVPVASGLPVAASGVPALPCAPGPGPAAPSRSVLGLVSVVLS